MKYNTKIKGGENMPIVFIRGSLAARDTEALVCEAVHALNDNFGQVFVLPPIADNHLFLQAVPPKWQGGDAGEENQLRQCYINALELVHQHKYDSVTFSLLGTGTENKIPKHLAMQVAISAIEKFTSQHNLEWTVYLVLPAKVPYELPHQLTEGINSYIKDCYVDYIDEEKERREIFGNVSKLTAKIFAKQGPTDSYGCISCVFRQSLEEELARAGNPFKKTLLRFMNDKNLKGSEVYKRANIDRQLFLEIRNRRYYQTRKGTTLSLAIALNLTLEETKKFISLAGYSLNHNSKADIIVEYFIKNEIYDILQINEALFAYEQPILS